MNSRLTQTLSRKRYTNQIKNLLLVLSLLITTPLIAQKVDKYIEVWQRVSYIGTTRIEGASYPQDQAGNPDSSINITRIEGLIKAARKDKRSSVSVLTELAKEGWVLVSTVFVPGSEFNSGFVSYYLRKTFDQAKP
jgi:hypothetical protein